MALERVITAESTRVVERASKVESTKVVERANMPESTIMREHPGPGAIPASLFHFQSESIQGRDCSRTCGCYSSFFGAPTASTKGLLSYLYSLRTRTHAPNTSSWWASSFSVGSILP